jgi:hypothetical protein
VPHDKGGQRGTMTQARAADRRGRAASRPGGSGWVQEEARASGAAWHGVLTDGPRLEWRVAALGDRGPERHSARRRGFKLD